MSRYSITPFLLAFVCTCVSFHTTLNANTPQAAPSTDWKAELQSIDAELKTLYSQLKDYHRKAFNAEMEAQPFMFDNWHQFAEGISLNEEEEKQVIEIQKKIRALNDRKQILLQEHPPQ